MLSPWSVYINHAWQQLQQDLSPRGSLFYATKTFVFSRHFRRKKWISFLVERFHLHFAPSLEKS